jgi:hypothetical protein
MGFLDNLESSLNNLERQEERNSSQAQQNVDDRRRRLASEPAAEQLKTSAWTKDLLDKSALAGHRMRAKVYIAWIGSTLRLEAKGRSLDLVPGPQGVTAQYEKGGSPVSEPVDFSTDPNTLLERWLGEEKLASEEK